MTYTDDINDITRGALDGFFAGWKNPPTRDERFEILRGSSFFIAALDTGGNAAGFITAVTDGVLSAFIPLLEVLPEYRSQGLGSELFRRMLDKLSNIPNIDLVCDSGLAKFYARFGMSPCAAMVLRGARHNGGRT